MSRKVNWRLSLRLAGMTIISTIAGGGCTSTTSTIVQRLDSDELVGNSNGRNKPFHSAKPFKGIPVTVSVPTHVDIRIDETLYFMKETMTPVVLTSRHLTAHPSIVYSDKLISVDPKRPAAGTLGYRLDFPTPTGDYTKDQRFSKIGYDVDDQTIKTITEILKNVVPSLGLNATKPKNGNAIQRNPGDPLDSLSTIVRTVAWKRFDLNACDLEACIAEFVSLHLNNCHSCNGNACAHPEYETIVDQNPVGQFETVFPNFIPNAL